MKNGIKVIRPGPYRVIHQVRMSKKTVENYYKMRQTPDSVVLFGDAMHLTHQNFPKHCWGNPAFPPTSETNSGRKRLNIIGFYDPASFSFTHLTGEENCNAERAVECLELIYKKYGDVSHIYLIKTLMTEKFEIIYA